MNRWDKWVEAASVAFTVLVIVIVFAILVGGLVAAIRLILWGLGIL